MFGHPYFPSRRGFLAGVTAAGAAVAVAALLIAGERQRRNLPSPHPAPVR